MKKRKLNLSKLSLNKEVISNLSQDRILGGVATVLENTCRRSCFTSCLCPSIVIECVTREAACNSRIVTCQPTSPLRCTIE